MLNILFSDDDALCERFLEINQWDSYKSEVLMGVKATQNTLNKYQSSLR